MKTYIVVHLTSGDVEVFDENGLDWQEYWQESGSGIRIMDTSKAQKHCIAAFRNEEWSNIIEVKEDKLTNAEKEKIRR